jgi:membrane-associated protein
MLTFVTDVVTSSPGAYPVIMALVALDALLPVIPAEMILMSGAVGAVQGDLILWLVFVVGLAGAMFGDVLTYVLGNKVGQPAVDRVQMDAKTRRRVRWARRKLRRHGEGLLVASRFLPLGRTAANLAAGMLNFPWRRFLAADLLAASLSVGYLVVLGAVGGRAFGQSFWASLALSVGLAAVLLLSLEVVRRLGCWLGVRGLRIS